MFKIIYIVLFVTFLYLINSFQKKFNFCLDKISNVNSHKHLLNKSSNIPLSGSFFIFPILFYLFYDIYLVTLIFSFFLILLGFLSDLNIANSPKLRLFLQFLILIIFLSFYKEIVIDTRIDYLNFLMNEPLLNILVPSFFFLVIINGFNFLDGVNNLCSLNFLIILCFSYLLIGKTNSLYINNQLFILILSVLIFVIFNFFGKNFLGDAAVYALSFFIGFLLIQISMSDNKISPYFIANLLWYPAFENLFSILRRFFYKKKNYLPDNLHLHQLVYKFIKKKNIFKKNYLLSSATGILLNMYLFFIFTIGYKFYSETYIQILLILFNTMVYFIIYYNLNKTLK